MRPVEPIDTVELFPPLHAQLLALLESLAPDDWHKPTVAAPWTVRDVVAHLLDTEMRRISSLRDGVSQPPDQPIDTYGALVTYIDQLNAEWVRVARRISPPLLVDFLRVTGPHLYTLFKGLDPDAPALGVAWAGETESPLWFDMAREYTEKWHHQQHIREAVRAPLLTERYWLSPVLDTFLRALPHTYRNIVAPDGTTIVVEIMGVAGDSWTLQRKGGAWHLYTGQPERMNALVRLDQELAWRLFTKGMTAGKARPYAEIEGDEGLGLPLLNLLAIMA